MAEDTVCAVEWIIYRVTCAPNGKLYFGLTKSGLPVRWSTHCSAAKTKNHSSLLHKAIRKYGRAAFLVEIVYVAVNFREAAAVERGLIAAYGTLCPGGYNLTSGGEGGGMAPELRARLSALKKGRPAPPGTIERLAAGNRGRKPSEETKRRISKANKGRKHTDETRARMSAWPRRRHTPEERLAQSERQTGTVRPLEAIRKTAEANRGRKNTPEAIERMRQAANDRGPPKWRPEVKLRRNEQVLQPRFPSGKPKGIRLRKDVWEVHMKIFGKQRSLGSFDTEEAAIRARIVVAEAYAAELKRRLAAGDETRDWQPPLSSERRVRGSSKAHFAKAA